MNVRNALAGVAVRSREDAQVWYERLLGRPADSVPMDEVAEWEFPDGGCLQVFADPDRAGSSSVTFSVKSLDEQIGYLEPNDIAVGQRTDSKIVRTALVQDPDGNQIVFAEALTDAIAQ
jgi:hypothetical protein